MTDQGPINLPDGPAIDLSAFVDPSNDGPQSEQRPPRRERIGERVRKTPVSRTPPVKRATEPASKPGEFVEPLEQMYTIAGIGIDMFDRKDHVADSCGQIVASSAHDIAVAWDELAQKNPQVRKTLRKLTQGSAWGGVFAAHLPIAIAIMANHMPQEGIPGPFKAMTQQHAEEPEAPIDPEPHITRQQAAKRTAKRPVKRPDTSVNERRSGTVTNG